MTFPPHPDDQIDRQGEVDSLNLPAIRQWDRLLRSFPFRYNLGFVLKKVKMELSILCHLEEEEEEEEIRLYSKGSLVATLPSR